MILKKMWQNQAYCAGRALVALYRSLQLFIHSYGVKKLGASLTMTRGKIFAWEIATLRGEGVRGLGAQSSPPLAQ